MEILDGYEYHVMSFETVCGRNLTLKCRLGAYAHHPLGEKPSYDIEWDVDPNRFQELEAYYRSRNPDVDGSFIHPLVHDALLEELKSTDPVRIQQYKTGRFTALGDILTDE